MERFKGELPADFVGGRKLIGVGESNHGSHEFFAAKVAIFKDLVKYHGFRSLLLEDRPEVCLPIQNLIENGSGDLSKLIKKLYPVWQCKELVDLIGWMRSVGSLQFIGFDVDQSRVNLDERDKIMSQNITNYLDQTNRKAMVWAHNLHIRKSAQPSTIIEVGNSMGYFLHQHFSESYAAVGQFAGSGSFRATKINIHNSSSRSRKLSVIKLPAAPTNFLEAKLAKLNSGNYFVDFRSSDGVHQVVLDKVYPARSIGWGLVPNWVDTYTEETNVLQQYDGLIFWPHISPAS